MKLGRVTISWNQNKSDLAALTVAVNNLAKLLGDKMAKLDDAITALTQQVNDEETVEASAVTLINGVPKLIADAVSAALAQGATPTQLQAITDLQASIGASSAKLAAAVTANTTPPAQPAGGQA